MLSSFIDGFFNESLDIVFHISYPWSKAYMKEEYLTFIYNKSNYELTLPLGYATVSKPYNLMEMLSHCIAIADTALVDRENLLNIYQYEEAEERLRKSNIFNAYLNTIVDKVYPHVPDLMTE